MGASGPPSVTALALLAIAALASTGCAPRRAAADPVVQPNGTDGLLTPTSARTTGSGDGSGDDAERSTDPDADPDDLATVNDDFAALAYALHGVEREGAEGETHDHGDEGDHEGDHEDDHEGDDIEPPPQDWQPLGVPPRGPPAKSPLADLSAEEIKRRLKDDPASLGSISIGPPNRGALFNGVQMPQGERWALTDPANAYGTRESVDQLIRCIDAVHEKYPKSPKMYVGHFSARRGGRLKPHKSHQAGRDVDVSYYYTTGSTWYQLANAKNLDRPRTWAFVKALLTRADVEMVLIDTSVQKLLRDYAISAGENRAFVDRAFQVDGEKTGFAPIRHARGHADHIHIRFRSPEAVSSGRIAEAFLPKPAPPPSRDRGTAKHAVAQKGDARAPAGAAAKSPTPKSAPKEDPSFVMHRARSGDTLDSLARRYGSSVAAIREANGLKGNSLKEKRSYKIPVAKPATSSSPAAGGNGRSAAKRKG